MLGSWGSGVCLKHEMAKWRNGTRDKSQGCKITVPLKLKFRFMYE